MNRGDGTFSEEGELRGVDDRGQGRGLVSFDYDRDGDLDLFVANHAGRPVLLRNEVGHVKFTVLPQIGAGSTGLGVVGSF